MKRIVIVGASLAAVNAVAAARDAGFTGELIVIGDEPHLPYDRPPLSKGVLVGAVEREDCLLRPESWYVDMAVELQLGVPARSLDLARRRVELADGVSVRFDGLVIATGASPRRLPGPWPDGASTLRTVDDTAAIRRALLGGARLAVVGGGFIGAEVAASAAALGGEVTIIESFPTLLSRTLGDEIGEACARLHEAHGTSLRCGVPAERIIGERHVEGVALRDGTVVAADLVVAGVGVAPNVDWLRGSGLATGDGVLCDAHCRTNAPGVVAAGDVARWDHPGLGTLRIEHWDNAVSQGQAAMRALLGVAAQPYAPVPYVWSDQYDTKIQVVGHPHHADDVAVVEGSLDEPRFVALFGSGGELTAAVSFNRSRPIRRVREMLATPSSFAAAVRAFDSQAATRPVPSSSISEEAK